jgi:peptidoglycan hydrolase-like protein with peptidoglycan-binding domain
MKPIRLFLIATALAVVSVAASLPASASAATSASTPICTGTSVVGGGDGGLIVVPTAGNGTGKWACDLLPSTVAGLAPVERLQIDLNDCFDFNLAVDGEYGQHTYDAVRTVQAMEGVPVDGDYGPVTIRGDFFYLQENTGNVTECTTIAGA